MLSGIKASRAHAFQRADLISHSGDHLGARADERQPGSGARARKFRLLGQKAVARVDRLGAGLRLAYSLIQALGRAHNARPAPAAAAAGFDDQRVA